ncbi:MAG: hypothetical protein E6Q59_10830 [Nitrosomonas sp.]|nr:MAG: hypothetical protein E6Q59_10830 [Nitrosomonas sp.]
MKSQLNTKKDLIKDIMNPFTLNEAVSLIYRLAVLKKDALQPGQKYSITQIGHICGVLTLNDQIEIVIKFHDEMRQFTKEEFYAQVKLLDE